MCLVAIDDIQTEIKVIFIYLIIQIIEASFVKSEFSIYSVCKN